MSDQYVIPQWIEYTDYAVRDLAASERMFQQMGFERVGTRTEASRKSHLYQQGDIRILLSASDSEKDPVYQFTRLHGDGVWDLGLRVSSSEAALSVAQRKVGARVAAGPELINGKDATGFHRASIHVFGDVRHTFLNPADPSSRFEHLFAEGFQGMPGPKGKLLQTVDHVTVNVERGQVDRWANFYKDLFNMEEVRYFDIQTGRTGLFSRAMRTPNGRLTMPFNEATDEKSQIQEFIDTFHGPGVQHLAFHTANIVLCLDELKRHGFDFLTVPSTYYEAIPKRVPNVAENMGDLERLGLLVDGSEKGYLLQIFTKPMIGPFFFEFIQRKGDNGFGEGNFRALFESIERDQIRRGVLAG